MMEKTTADSRAAHLPPNIPDILPTSYAFSFFIAKRNSPTWSYAGDSKV